MTPYLMLIVPYAYIYELLYHENFITAKFLCLFQTPKMLNYECINNSSIIYGKENIRKQLQK